MTKPKNDLTAEAVRRLLLYDAFSGLWQYRIIGPHRTGAWFAGTADPKSGYLRIQIGARKYLAHRLAWLRMKGRWPRDEIDHHDLDKANNRWANLREATHVQRRRKPTKPTKASVERRLDEKKRRSTTKRLRRSDDQ